MGVVVGGGGSVGRLTRLLAECGVLVGVVVLTVCATTGRVHGACPVGGVADENVGMMAVSATTGRVLRPAPWALWPMKMWQ